MGLPEDPSLLPGSFPLQGCLGPSSAFPTKRKEGVLQGSLSALPSPVPQHTPSCLPTSSLAV